MIRVGGALSGGRGGDGTDMMETAFRKSASPSDRLHTASECTICNIVSAYSQLQLTLQPHSTPHLPCPWYHSSPHSANRTSERATWTQGTARGGYMAYLTALLCLSPARSPRRASSQIPTATAARSPARAVPAYSISLASCGELDASASPTAYPKNLISFR